MSKYFLIVESMRQVLSDGFSAGQSGPALKSTTSKLASAKKSMMGKGMVGKSHQQSAKTFKRAMRQHGKALAAAGDDE